MTGRPLAKRRKGMEEQGGGIGGLHSHGCEEMEPPDGTGGRGDDMESDQFALHSPPDRPGRETEGRDCSGAAAGIRRASRSVPTAPASGRRATTMDELPFL